MRFAALSLTIALSLPAAASADVVAQYDFSTNLVSSHSNVDVTPLVHGGGLNPVSIPGAFASMHWKGPEAGDFFSFKIAPTSGYQYDLTSFSFGTFGDSTPNEPVAFELYSSLDEFASSVFSVPLTSSVQPHLVSLGADFMNLTQEVEFRFIATGATANGKLAGLSNVNGGPGLIVNGLVSPASVPEPGSIVLLTLTGLGAVGARTMRKRRTNRTQAA